MKKDILKFPIEINIDYNREDELYYATSDKYGVEEYGNTKEEAISQVYFTLQFEDEYIEDYYNYQEIIKPPANIKNNKSAFDIFFIWVGIFALLYFIITTSTKSYQYCQDNNCQYEITTPYYNI